MPDDEDIMEAVVIQRDVTIYPRNQTSKILKRRLEQLSRTSREIHKDLKGPDYKVRKAQLETRQNLLRELDRDLVSLATPDDTIFISYSGHGRNLGDIAKRIAEEYEFNVKTGFDAEVEMRMGRKGSDVDELLPNAIMAHIISCNCFLGIWTDDFDSESKPGLDMRGNRIEKAQGHVPSVWMPFELGVAASHDIPFRMLVVEGTHRLYYEKPFHLQTQVIFKREEFEQKATKVIKYLSEKVKGRKKFASGGIRWREKG